MKGEHLYEIRTRYKSVWHLTSYRPRFMPCNLLKSGMITPVVLFLSSMSPFQPYWYKNNHTNRKNRWYESNIVFFILTTVVNSSDSWTKSPTYTSLSIVLLHNFRPKLKQAQSNHFRVVTTRGVYILRSDITWLSDLTILEV